ncbi:MAG: hypothetical protein COV44_07575 [Deltaproteobacteria bacterium CG11_big_fil_rev_8_21_14_0_20_45_16]|nr:MAG: hypothetical protein COV44_07575 [Deltaproteobacteria bacterium CG11_big_fil_rev_8_21_14_0_20_45_16]
MLEAEQYIIASLGFFSFVTEDLHKKVAKYKDVSHSLYPLIIESQDILRGCFASQSHLILATSAFNLRAIFEIRANMKYIFSHSHPTEMGNRLIDFIEYEKLVGTDSSPLMTSPDAATLESFATTHSLQSNTWVHEASRNKRRCFFLGTKRRRRFLIFHE